MPRPVAASVTRPEREGTGVGVGVGVWVGVSAGVGVWAGGSGVSVFVGVGVLLGGTEVAVSGIDVGVGMGVFVGVGASAVSVARMPTAIFVAWASSSAWECPRQAARLVPTSRHTRITSAVLPIITPSFSLGTQENAALKIAVSGDGVNPSGQRLAWL
jgi:hypothetical protein